MWRGILVLLMIFGLSACSEEAEKDTAGLTVSAASSLTEVMGKMEEEFHQLHPEIGITFNYGSSGKLRSQIEQGAPADLFLSASERDMEGLVEKGLILSDSVLPFAENRLVLASAGDRLPGNGAAEALLGAEKAIAVGEPESVPLGQYTKKALMDLTLWNKLEGKLVYAKDARQVLSYIESGNAEIGIVYASDAHASADLGKVEALLWDSEPIVYPAGILADSKYSEEAQAFLEFLSGPKGRKIFEQYGFLPVGGEAS